MDGFYTITVLEAGTNRVLNPSAERDGSYAVRGDATITRSTDWAHRGIYSYRVETAGIGDGIDLTLAALVGGIHTVTLYMKRMAMLYYENADTYALISGYTGLTGATIGNTQAGKLYLVVEDNGMSPPDTDHRILIYKDLALTQLVAHSAWVPEGSKQATAITADDFSGLGGTLILDADRNTDGDDPVIVTLSCGVLPAPIALQASMDGSTWHDLALLSGVAEAGGRYHAQIPEEQAHGATQLCLRQNEPIGCVIYLDAMQVEAHDYVTTYMDGDQPGHVWGGEFHASASARDAQYRPGGRERNLEGDYGIKTLDALGGIGLPPIANHLQNYALRPGARFQSASIEPRLIDFVVTLPGTSMAMAHQIRKNAIALFGPGEQRGWQPARLGYLGANAERPVYCLARYHEGLQFSNVRGYLEQPVIRLICEDPNWYEDRQEQTVLDFSASVANANYGLRRDGGAWQSLGTGFNATVLAIAVDEQRGRIYFGGGFTTANGVTVNRICYWDGATFQALGAGVDSVVRAIAIAPNGDVWIGGEFLTAGGSNAYGLARWNVASSTWTCFTNGTGTTIIRSIAIDLNNNVYIGGDFTNFDGIAAADYVAKYNQSAWAAVGTSPFDSSHHPWYYHALICDGAGNLYAGSGATSGPAAVCALYKWNGSSWTTLGSTDSRVDSGVHALALDDGGNLYVGGDFGSIGGVAANSVAVWNGQSFQALGGGATPIVYDLVVAGSVLYIGAPAAYVPGSDYFAAWNGSVWFRVDVDLPSTSRAYALAIHADRLFIGFDHSGTATAAEINTVAVASTTETFPIITLIGPGTLIWFENQSTLKRLYLNLTAQAGETIRIDLRVGEKTIVSDWRGSLMSALRQDSNFGSFSLLPGDNAIAAYLTGGTSDTRLIMNWIPAHASVDGVAA